jgi:putative transposase
MEQAARNLTDAFDGFLRDASHLIHDRDPLFTRAVDEILVGAGVTPIKLPPPSPNLNAFAERFVRSIKEECLSRVVVLGEGHLHLLVSEYVDHYHRERNHQGVGNRLLEGDPAMNPDGAVRRRRRVGGLLNYYHREAA